MKCSEWNSTAEQGFISWMLTISESLLGRRCGRSSAWMHAVCEKANPWWHHYVVHTCGEPGNKDCSAVLCAFFLQAAFSISNTKHWPEHSRMFILLLEDCVCKARILQEFFFPSVHWGYVVHFSPLHLGFHRLESQKLLCRKRLSASCSFR